MSNSMSSSMGGGMSSSTGGHMQMGVFHWTSGGDAIFFNNWMPTSEASYAGTCILIIVFTVLCRGLVAIESYYAAWISIQAKKKAVAAEAIASSVPNEKQSHCDKPLTTPQSSCHLEAADNKPPTSTIDALFRIVYPPHSVQPIVPPFSWSKDTIRSCLTALSVFFSYLLMMIVMSGNGGYLFCVVGGFFIGEMLFGRYRSVASNIEGHTCC
ncbi:Ctr copper transporter [Spinellus fusiger]|nr:Ctr copper transporter [Spinellus fusiger]